MTEFCEAIKKDYERCMCKTDHWSATHTQWRCGYHTPFKEKLALGIIEIQTSLPKMKDQELINLLKPHPNNRDGMFWECYIKAAWEELEKRFLKTDF